MNLSNNVKTLKIMTIIIICLSIVDVVLLILSVISLLFLYIVIPLLISLLVLNLVCAIKIMTTNWQDEKLNNDKTLWGILAIVILGWIALLTFIINANQKLKNNDNVVNN